MTSATDRPPWLYGAVVVLLTISCADIPSKPVPLVHVTGSVTDRDGAPVDGAQILFEVQGAGLTPPTLSYAETDSAGAYAIDLDQGLYLVRVSVLHALGVSWYRTFEARIDPLHARLDYRFADYWVVRGRVLDPTGGEVVDARLFAFQTVPNPNSYAKAQFDGSGFTVLLSSGEYDVYAGPNQSGTGFPGTWVRGISVASDTTWEIRLAGDPLTGTVTGPLGGPLAGVILSAEGPVVCSGATDAAGGYRLYLPPGVYRLSLGDSPSLRAVDPPELPYIAVNGPATYDISVTGVSWSGSVRLSGSGDPVPGAALAAARIGTYSGYPRDTTDASGRFEFVVQPGRAYTLEALETPGVSRERTWSPVIAGGDSTFDLLVDPAAP
jgi:hypothetical protein